MLVVRRALRLALRDPPSSPSSSSLSLRLGLRGSSSQRRWAQVLDVRFLATQRRPSRRVVEEYRDKLDRKAREEGVRDLDELRERYREKIERVRREGEEITADAAPSPSPSSASSLSESTTPQPQPPPPPPPQQQNQQPHVPPTAKSAPPGTKPLSSIISLPKIAPLPASTISTLWTTHHSTLPNTLSASTPLATFTHMHRTAVLHPSFILPLPRPPTPQDPHPQQQQHHHHQPFEIHYLQWLLPPHHPAPTLLLTSLAAYKLHREFATPHTTLTHYLDLAADKDIVLLRGDVTPDLGVSVADAQWLVMCLQKFYGPMGQEGRRRRLLEAFSRGDDGFRVEDVVAEVERID
ncbi:MAG: hypothetical protein M1813_008068 [Trichoglossum hirsutum]|nr:MAG: hypothetical protein M1813_008068 [Trichoglossum hirsutum]